MKLPVFPLLLASLASALDTARVCQSSYEWAPMLSDCQGARTAVQAAWPGGIIIQSDRFASCQVIFENKTCRMAACSFPGQGVNVTDFLKATDDILNNCQTKSSSGTQALTGGYEILSGTNTTVGVYGDISPYQHVCTEADPSSAPLYKDCLGAINSLNDRQNYTQSNKSGCSQQASSGTCSVTWCDMPGAQVLGAELKQYLNPLLLACSQNTDRAGGFAQVTPDKRVGFSTSILPLPAIDSSTVCQNFTDGNPKQQDCSAGVTAIKSQYPTNVKQDQSIAQCKTIYKSGNNSCQIDLCAPNGEVISTSAFTQAFNSVSSQCRSGTSPNQVTGGRYRVPFTNSTIVFSSTSIPHNIFCNPSPNNSPPTQDCQKVLNSLSTTGSWQQTDNPGNGCSLLAQNGTCKLNYCAPQGSIISKKDVYSMFSATFAQCNNGQYVSGIYQLNLNSSVGIYDPPYQSTTAGQPSNQTTAGRSPNAADCLEAINQLIGKPTAPCANNMPTGPSSCTKLATVGTCQLQICSHSSNAQGNPSAPFPYLCNEISQYFLQLFLSIAQSPNPNQGVVGGQLGLRNAYYGDTTLQIVSAVVATKKRSAHAITKDLSLTHPHGFSKRDTLPDSAIQTSNNKYYINTFQVAAGAAAQPLVAALSYGQAQRAGAAITEIIAQGVHFIAAAGVQIRDRSEDLEISFSAAYDRIVAGTALSSLLTSTDRIDPVTAVTYAAVKAAQQFVNNVPMLPEVFSYEIYRVIDGVTTFVGYITIDLRFDIQNLVLTGDILG